MGVESAKDRLSAVYDYLRYVKIVSNQKDFAAKIGINKASMSSAMNGEDKYLTTGLFGRIHNSFPQFNKAWLLTGEGEMLNNIADIVQHADGDNNTQVAGYGNSVNFSSALDKALDEIAEMRKLLDKSIQNNKEQADKFFALIELIKNTDK